MHLKDTAAARSHNEEALRIAQELGDSLLIMHAWENLGQLALRSGAYTTTCANCSLVYAYAQRHHMLSFARDAMRCIMDGHRLQGNWHLSLLALMRYNDLRDSTYDASSREEILRRSLRKEASRREYADSIAHTAEVERLRNERTIEKFRADRNRDRLAVLGFGAIFLAAGSGLFFHVDRRRRRERFERDAAILETKALRAQMNPHFIFNALNSIGDFIDENEKTLARDYLMRFAGLMRAVLENSRHAEVPLAEDLKALRTYLELERLRMSEKFDFKIDVDPSVDQVNTLVPPLVLQPFIENAIWHGIGRKKGKGHIAVRIQQQAGHLLVHVEDDGPGRTAVQRPAAPADNGPKTSLGTAITRARLEAVGRQHQGRAGFHYEDLPQGLRVVGR
ncbi:MAG: histidine kinase [Flavobacteriales bacterium]|nr:histidine kinase [Flavobacteriales bacterium]